MCVIGVNIRLYFNIAVRNKGKRKLNQDLQDDKHLPRKNRSVKISSWRSFLKNVFYTF
jgi:hypothetical protein